jgi:aldehyde:ferredoxin oxidoreductase
MVPESVRFAGIRTGLKHSAARTVLGAVMGSKSLKAVAARGSLDIIISDPITHQKYYFKQMKNLMETKWLESSSPLPPM